MKDIVFITKTPLAGAPIRIANAINKYSDYNVRVINLNPNQYGNRTFEEDLIWFKDKNLCIELIKKADILHIHHWIDLSNNDFGVDFKKIIKNSCKIVMHFHSDKNCILNWGINPKDIEENNYTKVVIAHSPERTFLEYKSLPNIIPINSKLLLPKKTNNKQVEVVFSTSFKNSLLDDRWQTKGYQEVHRKLKTLSKKYKFKYHLLCNKPYIEAMRIKQNADIIIGDIVTGSYHLTELESLSQGKVVLTKLDGRTILNCTNVLNCKEIPFVNTNLITLESILSRLIYDKDLRNDIGTFSRWWIEKYYNDESLVKHFIDLYDDVLSDNLIKRDSADNFKLAKEFLYNKVYDYEWLILKNKTVFFRYKQFIKKFFSFKKTIANNKKHIAICFFGIKIKLKVKS